MTASIYCPSTFPGWHVICNNPVMKIMLFDETPERSLFLRMTLERLGHEIVAEVADSRQLYDAVRSHSPDAIIIDTESPSRDTLEHLCMITESCPRPIVMFTEDRNKESIREAVRAGVTAYIVDGLAAERIEPIIETAVARDTRGKSGTAGQPRCNRHHPVDSGGAGRKASDSGSDPASNDMLHKGRHHFLRMTPR